MHSASTNGESFVSTDGQKYKVEYFKAEGPFWSLHIPEIERSTQAEGWCEVDTMARVLISVMRGRAPGAFDLVFTPLPAGDRSS